MASVNLPDWELEQLCYHCMGTGKASNGSDCKKCDNGYYLTEDGHKLLAFLRRHPIVKLEGDDNE